MSGVFLDGVRQVLNPAGILEDLLGLNGIEMEDGGDFWVVSHCFLEQVPIVAGVIEANSGDHGLAWKLHFNFDFLNDTNVSFGMAGKVTSWSAGELE
jgi:hypothetical protein